MNYTIEIALDTAWNVSRLSKDWRKKHWICSITDGNRAITWDCYGGSMAELNETEALYYLLSDAETFIDIHTFGYTDYVDKNVYNGLRDSYNKAIQFFGTDERFVEVLETLRQQYDY